MNKKSTNNNKERLSVKGLILIGLILIIIGISLSLLWIRHVLPFLIIPGIVIISFGSFFYIGGLLRIKKKRMNNRVPIILTIALIFVLILLSSIIWIYTEPYYTYEYEIEIYPSNNKNYTLFLPIPILNNGSLSKIVNNIRIIEGECNYKVIETQYGKALNISGNGSIILKSKGKLNSYCYDHLSLWAQDKGEEIWIYGLKSNDTNINFKINARCDSHHGILKTTKSKLEGTIITNGWQKFQGYETTYID